MATIPETPPEEQTLPGSRDRARAIPTVEESSGPTPQNNFTTPFISGESTLRGISELTDNLNRVSDAYVEREAKIKGAQDQQQAIAEGRSDYVGTGTAFTLAGRNYEAGATIALINKKRSEIDEQLKPLALKRKNDINLFSKEADEIRNRLVQNLPSSVAVQVNEEYLKEKGNLTTQIQLNQVKEQIEENRITILDGNDRETKKMMDAIRDQGMGATQIMDSLININSNVEGLSSLGLTPNEIRKEMDKQRKKIFSLYLYQYEFQKYANDPAGLEKLKTELRNGTYQWGDLGNEFGNYIPGGKDITVAEGQVYHKVVEQYEADYAKENAGQRYLFNIDHKQKADSIADGQSGFTVTWSTDPNGEPVKIVGLDPNYNAYDTAKSRLLGNDAADILKQKLELESSVLAGQLVLQTKIGNEATMNNAYTSIAQFEAKANDPKSTAYEKGLYGQAADKARTRVDKIIKNRLADKTSGESMNMFWETRAAYGIDPNINITTAEGFRVLQKEYEKYNNSPMRDTEFPTQQANIELSQIRQSANISMASGMASLDQLNARMKEYSTAVLSSALKAAGDEKNNDYALIEIMNLRKQGRLAESERLFSAWKDSEQNEKILKQSDPNYKTYKDSFESKFRDEFKNTIDLKTSYGKSLYSTSHALWLKNLQAGVMNNRDSMDSAITFVKQHHVSLQLDDGLTILFPRSYLRDDNGTDRRNYIENELNDVLNKPWLHNVIPASGQTFDRITNNKDQYKFVFDNGQFVLRDKAGDIVAQPLQKYPSDERTLIYSDMVISPGNSKKSKTVFEDRENTWANGGKKTFTNLVGDGPNVSTYLFTDRGENKIEKYADKMQRVFVENYVNQDKKLKYVDWAVPHMVGIDARKQTVAQAISLKAAENGLNQADLVWLANNSVTASRVGLDRKDNRDYVINKFNSDYDKISKLTTPTNAATRMSPMQVILKLSDEYNTIGKK